MPLAIADSSREIGVWLYDSTLGVPVYVQQNPWSFFDPEGMDMKRAGENLDSALRAIEGMFTRNPSEGMEAGTKLIEAAMEVVDSGIDKISGNPKGGENAVEYAAGFNPVVAAVDTAEQIQAEGVSGAVVAGIVLDKTLGKIPGLKGKGGKIVNSVTKNVDNLVDSARDVLKKAKKTTSRAAKTGDGTIYKVPGTATPSGKPYIGRHNKPEPQKTRASTDGRDRTQAEVINTYDTSKPMEGRVKEQAAIDAEGGVPNLDNKRNEIRKKK